MLKILIILGLCGAALAGVSADIRKEGDVCYWRGKPMAIGDVIRPKTDCVQVMCNREGSGTMATIETCGSVSVAQPGYKVVRNHGAPYPDCCPKPVPVSESKNSLTDKS